MGADDLDLKGVVEFRLKGDGLKDAGRGLDKVADKSDKAKAKLTGAEQAAKLLDETLPSNALMEKSWKTSEGKPI